MQTFADFARRQSLETLEELYTKTFDTNAETTLYFGHHLFGETQKRSSFMVKLQDAYISCNFSSGAELADHLCTLLQFLSVTSDAEFAIPLIDERILPSLQQIEKPLRENKNGYAPVMEALKLFLQQVSRTIVKAGGLQYA